MAEMDPLTLTLLAVKGIQLATEAIALAQVDNMEAAEAKLAESQEIYAAGVAAWEASKNPPPE